MTKIVYLFDENTREFNGEYLAQQSPLEPDVYIEPVHSTPLLPLPFEQGKYNYFDGNQWTLKDDTRGKWFKPDRSEVEVMHLTELIDSTWTRIKPSPTQEELDFIATAKAKETKDAALNAITVTTSSGKTFDGNDKAIGRMMAAIKASEITGITSSDWVLADNTKVLVTIDEVKEALALSIQRVGEIVTAP